jgi:hypothetical protein
MKKTLIFIAIITIKILTANSQTNKFEIGAEGGPSLIFIHGNEILEKYHDPSLGFAGGISFQYNFYKILSLRTGLSYERKGCWAKFKVSDVLGQITGEATNHTNYDYITIPILLRATFCKKVKFFINVGPYFGYLIQCISVTKGDDVPYTKWNYTSQMKRFDAGITTGIGLIIPIRKKFAISLEARNNMGLYNVSALPVYHDGSIINNSTNLLFGFTYRFGFRPE